jgi:hypothetical protein
MVSAVPGERWDYGARKGLRREVMKDGEGHAVWPFVASAQRAQIHQQQ